MTEVFSKQAAQHHTVKVPMPSHIFKSSDWSILKILLACVADEL